MAYYSKSFTIEVTATSSGKTKVFTSIDAVSKSTGISKYILRKIRKGEYSHIVLGKKDITFLIKFIEDKACSLYPAWDTSLDAEPVGEQVFSSHSKAIAFLSSGGSSKHRTYYRRMNMQPLGVPCSKTISDPHGYEWIITFYKEKESFVPNKKKD